MPSILFCLLTLSEVDIGGMAVKVEPSYQYPITFYCCATGASRGAVWQNGVWHGRADEAKVCHGIPPCGKKWHQLTLIDACSTLTEIKQWVWTQWAGGWCILAVAEDHLHWKRFLQV